MQEVHHYFYNSKNLGEVFWYISSSSGIRTTEVTERTTYHASSVDYTLNILSPNVVVRHVFWPSKPFNVFNYTCGVMKHMYVHQGLPMGTAWINFIFFFCLVYFFIWATGNLPSTWLNTQGLKLTFSLYRSSSNVWSMAITLLLPSFEFIN